MAGNTDLRKVFIEVTGTSEQARKELNDLRRSIAAADTGGATIEVDVDGVAKAQAEIASVQQAMQDLNGTHADPRIRIKVDDARARLAELENDVTRAAAALEAKNINIGSTGTGSNVGEVRELQRALRAVESETVSVERAMRRWAAGMIDPQDNLNAGFKGLIGLLKQIAPLMQGLGLVIFSTLLPALAGLASGAVAAAGGIASLGPAALAAGGAMAIGLVAVVKSVGQVLDLRKRKQQALDSQTRQAAQRDDQLAAANRTVAESQRAVRDATEQRATAVRNIAEAEKGAAEGIARAQSAAADASKNLKAQTVNAYEAMRDAARDAERAVLGVQDAQLTLEESKLDLKDAERALKNLGKTGGQTLQDLASKATDVSYDPGKLAKEISSARKSGAIDDGQGDQLERLTVAVERARLREKQATLGVKDANDTLTKSRKTEADFAAKGIAAYEPYTDAIKQNTTAQKALAEVQRQGIAGNPQVIAAKEQLRDANQRIVESEQRVKDAVKARADVMKGDVTGPMALYKAELAKLTDGQRKLYDALDGASGPFTTFRNLIADPILSAGADAITAISKALGGANGWASKLGAVGAKNIRDFMASLKGDPKNAEALGIIGDESLRTAGILGGPVWRNFVRLMRNFAAATLPLLNEALQKLGDKLGRAGDKTSDFGKLREEIRPLLRLAGAFASVVSTAIAAVFDLGRALEPVLTPFLGFLKQGIQQFRNFTNSAKGGDRIRKFFADTLPLVKSVITFVVTFGKVFLQAFQFLAPVIKPIIDILTGVLKVFSFILEKLLLIPAPVRGLLSLFIPFGAVLRVLRGVGKAIEALGPLGKLILAPIRLVIGVIGRLARGLFGPFKGAFDDIAGAARGFASALGVPWRLIKAAVGLVGRAIVHAFTSSWDRVKDVFSGVGRFFRGVFGGIGKIISGIFDGVLGLLKGAVNGIIGVLNIAIDGINLAIKGYNKVPFHKDVGKIDHIPKLATGGVATRSTIAEIGEGRSNEAVLPLTASILSSIGRAIVAATPRMSTEGPQTARNAAPAPRFRDLNVFPQVPAAENPDPVWMSHELGRLMETRGS